MKKPYRQKYSPIAVGSKNTLSARITFFLVNTFPSRFATDKEVPEEIWYRAPIDNKADLKGSLRGIIRHFDHIRNLGVDILYMTPIFRSDSVHKYNIHDYYQIDPAFGDREDLKELVKVYRNGILKEKMI